MSQKLKMTGLGMSPFLADVSAAGSVSNTQTATGSTSQSGSFAITQDVTNFTVVSSNNGCRLPIAGSPGEGPTAGDFFIIGNSQGSNALLLYPPLAGTLNGLSANTSISIPASKTAMAICLDGTNYIVNLSA